MIKYSLRDFLIPTPNNNFRALLLTNTSLATITVLLVLANITFGSLGITKAFADFQIAEIISLHNSERNRSGLDGLVESTALNRSAQAKADAMLNADCWAHYCPNGKSPWEFFQEAGYSYLSAGENLAEGFEDANEMMRAWMNSKTHRENILKTQFKEIGIGIAYGSFQGLKNNIVVVVHFGNPKLSKSSQPNSSGAPTSNGQYEITAPKNGSVLNQLPVEIRGNASNDLRLDINKIQTGRISPSGGIFTYSAEEELVEGINSVTAKPADASTNPSAPVEFTIDRVSPLFDPTSIDVSGKLQNANAEGIVTLAYASNESLSELNLSINETTYSGKSVDGGSTNWSVEMPERELITAGVVKVIQIDLAGNQTTSVVDYQTVQTLGAKAQAMNANSVTPTAGAANNSSLNVIERFLSQVGTAIGLNPVQLITLSVLSLLIILFIADYIYLRRYNRQHLTTKKSRANLHLPTLVILAIIILIGNFKGNI